MKCKKMSESPNISIYLNRPAVYHALIGVTYVQKCFILLTSFSATKEIETLSKCYVIHIFTYGCICHTSCYWCRQIRSYCWYSIGSPSYRETVLSVQPNTFLCKTILRVSSPGHSGGGAGKARRAIATTSLEFKFHL